MFRCRRCGCPIYGSKRVDKCPSCGENPILQKDEMTSISPKAWREMARLDRIEWKKSKKTEGKK